jgi:hypothetical protein
VSSDAHAIERLIPTFKKAAATLKSTEIPFMLGGGLGAWARGGPETGNDLDFFLKPSDTEAALEALASAGMRPEHPPEDWLVKAWDGEVLVDLIFHPLGMEITDDVLARAEELNVSSIWTPVMAVDDIVSTKLLALNEHFADFEGPLGIARALREQIDWSTVRERTRESPFARAFFVLLDELEIATRDETGGRSRAKIKVVPARASATSG